MAAAQADLLRGARYARLCSLEQRAYARMERRQAKHVPIMATGTPRSMVLMREAKTLLNRLLDAAGNEYVELMDCE